MGGGVPQAGSARAPWPWRDTLFVLTVTAAAYGVLPAAAPPVLVGTLDELLLGVALGIVVGIGLRIDSRVDPLVGVVAFATVSLRFLLTGTSASVAVPVAVLIGIQIVLLLFAIRRTGAKRLERPADVLALVVITVCVGLVLGVIAAGVFHVAAPGFEEFAHIVRSWAIDCSFGIVCIAPAFLTVHRPARWSLRSTVEFAIVAAVSVTIAWLIFGTVRAENPGLLGWPYLMMLGPLWIAIRLGVAAVAPVTAVVAWLAVASTAEGNGPYARAAVDVTDRLVAVELFVAVVAVTLLLVAVLRDARLRSMNQLRESARLLNEVIDGSNALVFAKSYEGADADRGRYVMANKAWADQVGREQKETLGRSDADLFSPDLAAAYRERDLEVMATNAPIVVEERGRVVGDSEPHYYSSSKFPLRDEDGRPWGIGGIATDTTDLVRALERERRQGDLLRAVFELSPTPAMRLSVDEQGDVRVLAVNSAMCRLLDVDDGHAEQCNLLDHVLPDDRPTAVDVLVSAFRSLDRSDNREVRQREIRMSTEAGRVVWVLMSAAAVGRVVGTPDVDRAEVVAQFEDFTARRIAEEALSDQALRDAVTGLPNRRALHDRLDQALQRLHRGQGALAVLFCDLDHFKDVNDTLGHQAGDLLLIDVARRMQSALRPEDTVARIGGDEFIAIGEGLVDVSAAVQMATRLIERIRTPWVQGDKVFRPSMSVGVAIVEEPGLTADEVLRRADLAMYRAKENGRGRIEVYEKSVDERYQYAVALQHDLRRAIDSDALELWYQPVVRLADASLRGAEALVRMVGRDGVILEPRAFVPQAETSGLIVPMGAWVIRKAIGQLKQWRDDGRDLTMAVNVSPSQLRETGFASFLLSSAEQAGVDPSWLSVEVTETALLNEPDRSMRELNELSRAGVRIALDDFGTGYSSLSWLTQFPVNVVKIDRSFTDELGIDERKSAIVSAVIQVSHDLGFSVVAEGVETMEQSERLIELGCDDGQGYLFGRPVSVTEPPWTV